MLMSALHAAEAPTDALGLCMILLSLVVGMTLLGAFVKGAVSLVGGRGRNWLAVEDMWGEAIEEQI